MEVNRFEQFSQFQINDFLTDIEITLSNGSIKAHKLILAGSSEFFKTLLSNDSYIEISSGVISLPTIELGVFNYIMDYIYMRSADGERRRDISFYIDVIETSDYLLMFDLINILDVKLSNEFSFSQLIIEIDRIYYFSLKNSTLTIESRFAEMIDRDIDSELLKLSPSVVSRMVDSVTFAVDENKLWKFIYGYLQSNSSNYSQSIFDCIRPGLLTDDHISQFYEFLSVTGHLWRSENQENIQKVLSKRPPESIRAMDFYSFDFLSRPRTMPYWFVVSSGSPLNNVIEMLRLQILSKPVGRRNLLQIPGNADLNTITIFRNHLAVLDSTWDLSESPGLLLNLVNYRHLKLPSWSQADSPSPPDQELSRFWGFSLGLLDDGDLVVLGGCYFTHANAVLPSNNVVRCNIVEHFWATVPNVVLPYACYAHACVIDRRHGAGKHQFLVSGGRSVHKYLRTFYTIDVETGVISTLPRTPFAVSGHSIELVLASDRSALATGPDAVVIIYGGVWDRLARRELMLFDFRKSQWHIVNLETVPGTVHVDYCCNPVGRQISTDKAGRDETIAVYDLRTESVSRSAIYRHLICLNNDNNDHDGNTIASVVVTGPELEGTVDCTKPIKFTVAMGMPKVNISVIDGRQSPSSMSD